MKIKKLEAIRGFTALYVVFHHYIAWTIIKSKIPPIIWLPFLFGQEAVILFFLMSGFVIYISSIKSSHISFRKYFIKRAVRIYPIAIVTFLLSILIVRLNHYSLKLDDVKSLIGNFLMLQDGDNKPGNIVLPFLKNKPLWSLSYEWWFYLMFYPIFIFFLKNKNSKIKPAYLVLGLSIIGWFAYLLHPNHLFLVLAYFNLWWAGVACAEVYLEFGTFTIKTLKPTFISLFIMTCLTIIPIITTYNQGGKLSQLTYPVLIFRHYVFSLIAIFLGFIWWNMKLTKFDFIFSWFEKLAPISYALYITHFIFIWLNITSVNPYMAIVFKLAFAFIISYILEVKMQLFVNRVFFKKNRIKTEEFQIRNSILK